MLLLLFKYYAFSDIDECGENTSSCNLQISDCNNLPGSYQCDCHSGYLKDQSTDICEGTFSYFIYYFLN